MLLSKKLTSSPRVLSIVVATLIVTSLENVQSYFQVRIDVNLISAEQIRWSKACTLYSTCYVKLSYLTINQS
jgi:hypothetical protein